MKVICRNNEIREDFEFSFNFGDKHLCLLEEEMKKIVKEALTVRVYEKGLLVF